MYINENSWSMLVFQSIKQHGRIQMYMQIYTRIYIDHCGVQNMYVYMFKYVQMCLYVNKNHYVHMCIVNIQTCI